jgi:hypothetical protein
MNILALLQCIQPDLSRTDLRRLKPDRASHVEHERSRDHAGAVPLGRERW